MSVFPGLGTLINVAAIIAGGIAGMLFGKFISKRFQEIMMMASGVSVIFLGIAGCLEKMLVVNEDGTLSSAGALMLIGSLVIGAVVGELIDFDGKIEKFGAWLKRITHSESDGGFVGGFVTTSITVSIGAMAVIGPINDAVYGDISVLVAKSLLDGIMVMIMTAALGRGCIFSALPVALIQGGVTALSGVIEPLLTDAALNNLSLVGSVLIFCVGLNLLWEKKVRVANLLPSIIVAVVWAFI